MTTVGTGKYTYQLIENWAKLPADQTFGNTSAVTTDSRDQAYVFQRKDPPVMIFDREGNFLDSWGAGVTGQGEAEPVPPAPQRTGGRGRHGIRLRPGE